MGCYHLIPARRPERGGAWQLHPALGTADAEIPCGKCLGCRTDRAKTWTIRATHEARLWEHNTFFHLTYDDTHLPPELMPRDLQLFFKRLRQARARDDTQSLPSVRSSSIRYMACGEYGDKTLRPHYHVCAFNIGFADQQRYNSDLNTSDTLTTIWGNGATKLAPFTPARAGYVASYLTKHGHRTYTDQDGVVLQQPFFRASNRPALGRAWLEKNYRDIQHGYVVDDDGQKHSVPRYYQKWMRGQHPLIQEANDNKKREHREDREALRRLAAETIHKHHQARRSRDGI